MVRQRESALPCISAMANLAALFQDRPYVRVETYPLLGLESPGSDQTCHGDCDTERKETAHLQSTIPRLPRTEPYGESAEKTGCYTGSQRVARGGKDVLYRDFRLSDERS